MINIFVNDVKGMFYLLTSSITIRKEVTILPSPRGVPESNRSN